MAEPWDSLFAALIDRYRDRRHPLEAANPYQLVVMVILSARDADRHINALAPAFFQAYPTMSDLAKARPTDLHPYLNSVRDYMVKCERLCAMAMRVGRDESIPRTMKALLDLPGIGRKSALVILRELKEPGEGIMVDLHVERVAPRIGVATGRPDQIEKRMMAALDRSHWSEAGMALSFLGREICRPSNPRCRECVFKEVCTFCKEMPESVGRTAKKSSRSKQ